MSIEQQQRYGGVFKWPQSGHFHAKVPLKAVSPFFLFGSYADNVKKPQTNV